MRHFLLYLFSFLSVGFLQKFWYKIYILGLAGMGYGYGINHLPHAKKIAYKKLGYENNSRDFVFFDVGANIGQTVQEISDLNLPRMQIFSFEPQKDAFDILSKKFFEYKNLQIFPFGFGDKNQDIEIFKNSNADTGLSIVSGKRSGIKESLSIRTIDDFCQEYDIKYISYLKMDIEGAEFFALKGAKNMLESGNIEAIEFEFLWQNINAKIFLKNFWDLLSEKYDFYRILPRGIYKIENYSHLLEIYCLSNFLCIKKG